MSSSDGRQKSFYGPLENAAALSLTPWELSYTPDWGGTVFDRKRGRGTVWSKH